MKGGWILACLAGLGSGAAQDLLAPKEVGTGGVRVYQDLGQGVTLGSRHPHSIKLAFGAAKWGGNAASDWLNAQTGGAAAAYGVKDDVQKDNESHGAGAVGMAASGSNRAKATTATGSSGSLSAKL